MAFSPTSCVPAASLVLSAARFRYSADDGMPDARISARQIAPEFLN